MSTGWAIVVGCAITTFAIKAAGPVVLGRRELPPRMASVVTLMAPALLAALVATHTFADGKHFVLGAQAAGVAVAGLVFRRTRSIPLCVITAAVVTAVLRAL
jgi:branched-subunit amino acid transport protein